MSLSALYLPHLSGQAQQALGDVIEMEGVLLDLLQAAQDAHPDLLIGPERFLPFLAWYGPADLRGIDDLRRLRAGDLYLLCACRAGDGQGFSLARLESRYLRRVAASLGRRGTPAQTTEDLLQGLRQLLLADRDGQPLPGHYCGRGDLLKWLHLAALREARRIRLQQERLVPLVEEEAFCAAAPDQELRYMKELYRREFRQAFELALASLSERERTLLRLHFVEHLNIDQIGTLYRVHRATAARWVQRAQKQLTVRTREVLLTQIALAPSEYDSILRLINSQLIDSIRVALSRPAAS